MPEMHFQVRWPDGHVDNCYSPSLVVREHLRVGASYPLPEFLHRVHTALQQASERVRIKYGHPCTRALGQWSAIEATAQRHPREARVSVLNFDPME